MDIRCKYSKGGMVNNITKCDINGNKVTLDYQALLRVAGIAVRGSMNDVARCQDKLQEGLFKADTTSVHLQGMWMKQAADKLAVATDVWSALKCGLTRDEVELVNKQEV